jgi:phenylpropionate dioxygenase-like ring-hydroxylating dioxygenase large terminal subunit
MEPATQARLVARIRDLQTRRSTDLAPRTYPVPAADYTSPATLARELAEVFLRRPLLAGLAADAREPGDWFSFEGCGRSVVVWRHPDGELRAFVNACRHRGMRVASGCGRARLLVCPYHAWSYAPDGRLNAIPGEEGFSDLDRSAVGLTPVAVREEAGLVFVGLDPAVALADASLLDGADVELAPFGLGAYHRIERRGHRFPTNWKLTIDSFMEAYHLHSLHKDTLRPLFHGNLSAFDSFGRHCRIVGVRRTFDRLAASGDGADLLPHVTLLYQLFPNAVLIYQQDHLELYQSFPDLHDPDACEVRVTLYAPTAPVTDAERAHWKRNLDLIDSVTSTEDFAACAAIQANLRAGAVPFLVLGRNEPGVAHFHRSLHAALDRKSESEAPELTSGASGHRRTRAQRAPHGAETE